MTLKNILITLLIPIVWGGVLYTTGFIASANFNFFAWGDMTRWLLAFWWLVGTIVATIIYWQDYAD